MLALGSKQSQINHPIIHIYQAPPMWLRNRTHPYFPGPTGLLLSLCFLCMLYCNGLKVFLTWVCKFLLHTQSLSAELGAEEASASSGMEGRKERKGGRKGGGGGGREGGRGEGRRGGGNEFWKPGPKWVLRAKIKVSTDWHSFRAEPCLL